MAVPKKRTSKAKRNMRRAHDSINAPKFVVEANGSVRRPHRLNLETGEYRGRRVLKASAEEIVE
ncbi:50S ribosomal protein L32 [Streptobacillus notomytis]|uniref:50S ribosomal protein L32 n=1 Tax=Streptobacillus notomytis TaxID=1712031 RepID=UPI000836FCFF|nr:50S ribosomal protein L32 [Streptobacillus notomytis]